MPPGSQAGDVRFRQIMLLRDGTPLRGRILHALGERRHRFRQVCRCHAKIRGQARPQPLPAKHVAIDDIEIFVPCGGAVRRPRQVARDLARVRHVGQTMPLRGRTGKDEGCAAGLAQIRVHGQGQTHVHGIAQRIADDGVRAVHAPRKTVLSGRFKQAVFLCIVKILHGLAALLFAERRHRHCSLAIRIERSQVVLEPRHQRRMAQVAGWPQGSQHIGHHGAVDADVCLLVFLARPSREEDVAGVQARQRGGDGRAIRRIELQGRAAGRHRRASARDARHLPAFAEQMRGKVAADDAAGADDEGVFLHERKPPKEKNHHIRDLNSYPRYYFTLFMNKIRGSCFHRNI